VASPCSTRDPCNSAEACPAHPTVARQSCRCTTNTAVAAETLSRHAVAAVTKGKATARPAAPGSPKSPKVDLRNHCLPIAWLHSTAPRPSSGGAQLGHGRCVPALARIRQLRLRNQPSTTSCPAVTTPPGSTSARTQVFADESNATCVWTLDFRPVDWFSWLRPRLRPTPTPTLNIMVRSGRRRGRSPDQQSPPCPLSPSRQQWPSVNRTGGPGVLAVPLPTGHKLRVCRMDLRVG
jgi:hypothetical protein